MKRSEVYLKLVSLIMKNGKKRMALKHFFGCLSFIKQKFKLNAMGLLMLALRKLMPLISVKKKYKAGQVVYVPYILTEDISIKLGLRWIIKAAKERIQAQSFVEKLAFEIYDAANNKGEAIKYKQQLYALALRNRSNIRYL
jgi:small subunit ribosomal protein S7